MPGFVDVSGMSYNDVKRMGREDDDVDFGSVPARRNPVMQTGHSVSDVWAAACAAQRINGEYVKEIKYSYDEITKQTLVSKRRNRDVMMDFLYNPDRILVEDVEQGEACREFLAKDITFRALKGRLTEFDNSVKKVLAVKDRFYTVANNYEMAVVACLPASFLRAQARLVSEERLARCKPVDNPLSDKVILDVEVLRTNYSQNYGIFWIQAVTADDRAVFFSYKNDMAAGTKIKISGTVKAHQDQKSQLNRVKVIG